MHSIQISVWFYSYEMQCVNRLKICEWYGRLKSGQTSTEDGLRIVDNRSGYKTSFPRRMITRALTLSPLNKITKSGKICSSFFHDNATFSSLYPYL